MTTDVAPNDPHHPALEHLPIGLWIGSSRWFKREAFRAVGRGWIQVITGRNDDALYLLRCWLTEPKPGDDGRWDSANSLLLHCFARGDDDEALHDHPWKFETTVLSGGYVEHLPPAGWMPGSEIGPDWQANHRWHPVGDSVHHQATDLHCVGQIQRDTWTLVRTGEREREWGFHPQGHVWQPWRKYLRLPDKAVGAPA